MNATFTLLWLPVVLAVALGGRLLDRARGLGFGFLGGLFWVALVLMQAKPGTLADPLLLLGVIAGAAAIVAVGAWSGDQGQAGRSTGERSGSASSRESSSSHPLATAYERRSQMDYLPITDVLLRFDDWTEDHRYAADPWPDFGEFLRTALYQLCGATHVRPYRVLSEGDQLVPLRAIDPGDTRDIISARHGVIGHVATSGVSYIAGDPSHGKLIDQLACQSGGDVAWCFAIKQGARKIGLVKVGQLTDQYLDNKPLLLAVEALICQFWTTLSEVCRSRAAETRDPASGLPTREPFLSEADRVLRTTYTNNEPVVLAIIAVEGVRGLSDRGDWEVADSLIADVAAVLQERIRDDDRLGRFDDSRFVLLLRRVDSALGRLIVDQLHQKLTALCGDTSRWQTPIAVRCGVAGSGTDQPSLAQLIARAIAQCHQARRTVVPIASDLEAQDNDDFGFEAGANFSLPDGDDE